MKRAADWLFYLIVRGFLTCLAILPLRVAYLACEMIALLVYLLDANHRRIGLINLRIAFPERDTRWHKRVLRRSFARIGEHAAELSRLPSLKAADALSRVLYEPGRGLENYHAVKTNGTGVLFVTAHISAWELLPAAHAASGYPLNFIVRPLDNPYLDAWSLRVRNRHGNGVIGKHQAVRRSLQVLRQGGDVGFLIDQNIQEKEGVFVPLFGKPACTTTSVAALALKTGSPVIPGFIYPTGRKGHYRIRFYPPIVAKAGSNHEDDIKRLTASFNSYVEEMIREFPDCWLWGHRRFRTQPDGSDPYAGAGG